MTLHSPFLFDDDDRVNGRDYIYVDDINDFHLQCIDGWKPKTSLEDGLRAQVEYLKGEMAKGRIK